MAEAFTLLLDLGRRIVFGSTLTHPQEFWLEENRFTEADATNFLAGWEACDQCS